MVKCQNCGCYFAFIRKNFVCPDCGITWQNMMLEDKSFYDGTIAKDYNSILAFEYGQIRELLECGQVYGLMLHIKDFYEIIIRLPVLMCAAVIFGKGALSPSAKELLLFLMSKPLSLGDWRQALNMLSKVSAQLGIAEAFTALTETTKKFANSEKNGDIVFWRNDTIAHGAMRLLSDPALYADVTARIAQITGFLNANRQVYTAIGLVTENGTRLIGEHIDFDTLDGALFASVGGELINLYPFMNTNMKGIYFFDRYIARHNRTDMVEYMRSNKHTLFVPEFKELYCSVQESGASPSLESDSYSVEERALCEKFLSVDHYYKPRFLLDALNAQLERPSSVFMLEMEKGMGKSTFIRAIDPFAMDAIELEDTAVRAFYINSSYNSRIDDFVTAAEDLLRRTGKNTTAANNLARLKVNTKNNPKALADFLNHYKKHHYPNKKLLFVLDGLDETRVQKSKNISDFIPRPEMLEDGVYVMVTVRTDSKNDAISDFCLNVKENFPGDSIVYLHDDAHYRQFLWGYFSAQVIDRARALCGGRSKAEFSLTEKEAQEVFAELNYKSMLEVAFYREIVLNTLTNRIAAGQKTVTKSDFIIKSELFESYFANIKNVYGSTYYKKFADVLSVITAADRALTLKDIALLSGNERPSFMFLGVINSMHIFLSTVRASGGTLFQIAHLEQRQAIEQIFEQNIAQCLRLNCGRVFDIMASGMDFGRDEDVVPFCLIDRIFQHNDHTGNADINKRLFFQMLELPIKPQWTKPRIHILNENEILKCMYAYYGRNGVALEPANKARLAYFLGTVGLNCFIINRTEQSGFYFDRAIQMYREALDALKHLDSEVEYKEYLFHFCNSITHYATLKQRIEDNQAALDLYLSAMELTKELYEGKSPYVDEVYYWEEHICLSNIYGSCGDYSKQIELAETALAKLIPLPDTAHKLKATAFAYLSLAKAHFMLKNADPTIEYSRKAIEFYAATEAAGRSLYYPDVFLAHEFIVRMLAKKGDGSVIKYIKDVLADIVTLENTDRYTSADSKLSIYISMLQVCGQLGERELANRIYNRAAAAYQRLSDEEKGSTIFAEHWANLRMLSDAAVPNQG